MAGRIAYVFGFGGPALAVDTACSSSLVGLAAAMEAVRRQSVKIALSGGANLCLVPDWSAALCQAGMLAPDSRCGCPKSDEWRITLETYLSACMRRFVVTSMTHSPPPPPGPCAATSDACLCLDNSRPTSLLRYSPAPCCRFSCQ